VLAGRWWHLGVCCRAGESPAAVLAPRLQPALPSQGNTSWMHELSFFLLLSPLAQASSVFVLRNCQQGGKCTPVLCIAWSSSPLLRERGEICRTGDGETLALPPL